MAICDWEKCEDPETPIVLTIHEGVGTSGAMSTRRRFCTKGHAALWLGLSHTGGRGWNEDEMELFQRYLTTALDMAKDTKLSDLTTVTDPDGLKYVAAYHAGSGHHRTGPEGEPVPAHPRDPGTSGRTR